MTGCRNGAHSNYGSEFFQLDAIPPDVLQLYGRTSTYLADAVTISDAADARKTAAPINSSGTLTAGVVAEKVWE